MERRDFLALTPAFPLATVSASLTLKEEGKLPVELDVSVVKLQPGDTLVLRASGRISYQQADSVSRIMAEKFPGVQALIIDDDLTLEGVLRGPS